jgi:hypothetical protein
MRRIGTVELAETGEVLMLFDGEATCCVQIGPSTAGSHRVNRYVILDGDPVCIEHARATAVTFGGGMEGATEYRVDFPQRGRMDRISRRLPLQAHP